MWKEFAVFERDDSPLVQPAKVNHTLPPKYMSPEELEKLTLEQFKKLKVQSYYLLFVKLLFIFYIHFFL